MRIIFVRHGDPDYKNDSLTPHGHVQARAVAERLLNENISKIYASPNGRAQITASYTAELLKLPIITLDYMHEISWGGDGIPFDAHPWLLSDQLIDRDDFDFFSEDWTVHPYFKTNEMMDYYRRICSSIDAFLQEAGYERHGRRFLCTKENDFVVAVFSHGGSGGCAISDILGLPFPYVASILPIDLTSVTMIDLPGHTGEYVHPRLTLSNDMRHTEKTEGGPLIQQETDERARLL